MSEETEMIERHAEATTSGVLSAIKPYLPYLVSLFVGGGVAVHGHSDAKKEAQTEWPSQVGDHLQDLLLTNNIQEKEIQELRNQIEQLKKEKQ